MKLRYLLLPLLVASIGGCSAMLESNATADLQKQCAAMGKQFVKTNSSTSDNPIYSKAQVVGVCVGPDDPRYVPAAPPASTTHT